MKRIKKILSCCLVFAVILAFAFQTASSVYAGSTDNVLEIRIVHTNDIHARVQENAKDGLFGMGKLKSVIDSYTSSGDASLVLNSGDLFHGLPIATLSNGDSVAQLVKACGFDAMTPGNHDWSYGKDRLKELGSIANVDILCKNVIKDDGSEFFDNPYLIKEAVKNGKTYKIGVFGVIDPSIYKSTAYYNVEGLTFADSVEYAKKAVTDLKSSGCDIIIALSHTNHPEEIAKQVDGVNVWLAGHEHIDIATHVSTPNGDVAYVIEDEYYLRCIGLIQLDCTLDEHGSICSVGCTKTSLRYAEASCENDPTVIGLLAEINEAQSAILSQALGESPVDLDGARENLRTSQTNLGKAISSAYLLETNADVAFENAGGIRASIAAGTVTYSNIISVSPYGNYVITKQITGKQLKEVMETVINMQLQSKAALDSGDDDAWPSNSGSYLQFSGMTVTYNPSLDMGARVISITVGDKPLVDSKLYTVAMNNYTATDSTYPALCNAEETGEYCACDQVLAKYFAQDGDIISADVSKITMVVTNRTAPASATEAENGNATPSQPTGDNGIPVAAALTCIAAMAILLSAEKKRKRITE